MTNIFFRKVIVNLSSYDYKAYIDIHLSLENKGYGEKLTDLFIEFLKLEDIKLMIYMDRIDYSFTNVMIHTRNKGSYIYLSNILRQSKSFCRSF